MLPYPCKSGQQGYAYYELGVDVKVTSTLRGLFLWCPSRKRTVSFTHMNTPVLRQQKLLLWSEDWNCEKSWNRAFTHLYNKGTECCTKLVVLTEVLCSIVRIHEGERLSLLPGILFSWLDDGLANRFDLIFAQNLQNKGHTVINTDKNSIGNTLCSVKILNILMVAHTHTANWPFSQEAF